MTDFIQHLETIDQNVSLWINSFHTELTDKIWLFFSDRLIWLPLYLLVLGLIIHKRGWKRGLLAVLFIALIILTSDQFCNLIKNTVCRLRPSNNPAMIARGLNYPAGIGSHIYGFFSAHAANAFGFAVAAGLILHSWGWGSGLCIWAALVGISRVFVGKHFLGDVLTGVIVGTVIALIFCLIYFRLLKPRTAKSAGASL